MVSTPRSWRWAQAAASQHAALRRAPLMLVASLIAASLLAACGFSGSSAPAAKGSLTIGDIEAVSGATAAVGASEYKGVAFGVDQINAAGGIDGHQIQLLQSNDNSDPPTAIAQVRALIDNPAVLAILGPTETPSVLASIPLVEAAGIAMLGSNSGGPTITNPVNPHVFRTYVNGNFQLKAVLAFLAAKSLNRVAIIYPTDGMGAPGDQALVATAPQFSVTVVAQSSYSPTTTNPTVEVSKAIAANPDAYIIWDGLNTQRLGLVLKTLRTQGATAPVILPEAAAGASFTQFAGSAAEGAYFLSQMVATDPSSGPQTTFATTYQKKYGTLPDENVLLGYVKVEIIEAAIKNVLKSGKNVDRAAVADALNHLQSASTVIGPISYTPTNHDGISYEQIQINQYVNGQGRRVGVY